MVRPGVYAAQQDPADKEAWSGLVHGIGASLAGAGLALDPFAVPPPPWLPRRRLVAAAMLRAGGPLTQPDRSERYARWAAARIQERLGGRDDLVFACGSIVLSRLGGDAPCAFWADATFASMVGYYPGWERFGRKALRTGHALEEAALTRAALAVYASDWAAQSAIADHGADPDRVAVVPFGPNLPVSHGADDVERWIAGRAEGPCRLLFVGLDWERKGGPAAVEATRLLRRDGIEAELIVVGPQPRLDEAALAFTRVVGRLRKSSPPEVEQLCRLYAEASVFVLPSRAECLGVVFSEASAFGVPSVACRTGGVPTAVRDGINGTLLDPEADGRQVAAAVAAIVADRTRYAASARAAFAEHRDRLSWAVAGATVADLLQARLGCS